jgi:light-regulated signal transduction histidine kinase (bacteriophytochrome)
MLLFRDVTELQQLQEERNKIKTMKMINAMVSHDLMAPITNIRKFADQIKKHVHRKN